MQRIYNLQAIELVLGNVHGTVTVFKGSSSHPWSTVANLGMVCYAEMCYLLMLSMSPAWFILWCNLMQDRPQQNFGNCFLWANCQDEIV